MVRVNDFYASDLDSIPGQVNCFEKVILSMSSNYKRIMKKKSMAIY